MVWPRRSLSPVCIAGLPWVHSEHGLLCSSGKRKIGVALALEDDGASVQNNGAETSAAAKGADHIFGIGLQVSIELHDVLPSLTCSYTAYGGKSRLSAQFSIVSVYLASIIRSHSQL